MILQRIVEHKREELQERKRQHPLRELQARPLYNESRRDFLAALNRPRAIIAEIKRASPSKGVIRADFDPVRIAASYVRHGAAALSVLTEGRFFQGDLEHLRSIRSAVHVPLLRKDFLFDDYQIHEARAYGADAVLLIVRMLDDAALHGLRELAESLGMAALVEVHDEAELARAVESGARLIGINNRNLDTFVTSLTVSERLAANLPSGVRAVAESGIESAADIARLERAGINVFLVGESLMRSPDPGTKLAELLAAEPSSNPEGPW